MRPKKLIVGLLIVTQPLVGCASSTPKITPIADMEEVKANRDVTLELYDGSYVAGKFKGVEPFASDEYAAVYEAGRYAPSGEPLLPRLGPVEILFDQEREVTGDLVGFEPLKLEILQPGSHNVSRLAYERIRSVTDSDGNHFDGPVIRDMAEHGNIRYLSRIRLESKSGERLIGSESVRAVHWADGGGGLSTTALVIAVGAVVALVAATSSDPPPPTTTGYASCPYVYSWTGSEWAMEAELFGGSFVASAQRTDTSGILRADTADGVLRLRMTNELNETQYVDRVRAFAVEHPRGTTVVPAEDGTPIVLTDAAPPVQARTLAGVDVTRTVERADSLTWTGMPGVRRAARDDGRDGLVVEFTRPHEAGTLDLALRLRNTEWGAWLQGQVKTLLGANSEAWYSVMEASPEARGAWEQAALREAMLRVQVETANGWRTLEHVWEVGPAVLRDRGVRLDLEGVEGDTVRLRLDSTAGLWEIDSIAASFGGAPQATVTELELVSAREADGRDLSGVLAQADGDRYTMPRYRGDSEIRFAVPDPANRDMERSFFVDATGYYRIHTPSHGDAQAALLGRLINEPGAFAAYNRELWDRASVGALVATPGGGSW